MKRHKKKRQPKSIARRKPKWFDPTPIYQSVIMALSHNQIALIAGQPFNPIGHKAIETAIAISKSAEALSLINKKRKQLRFKATGRYEH